MVRIISDLLIDAADKQPDKQAVFYKDETFTYSEIYEQSKCLASSLLQIGVKKGERVCVYIEKRFEKVIAIYGISLVGAIFVPIRRLSTTAQALYIIDNCEATVLITTSSRAQMLKDQLKYPITVIVVDSGEISKNEFNVIKWEDALSRNLLENNLPKTIGADIAALLYTSGSTGFPKGVVLSHSNIVEGAKVVTEYLKIDEKDRLLSILSFGFDYGLNQLTTAFLNNAQLVLYDYLFPKDILEIVKKYQITGLAAVATTWIQLLQVDWGDKMNSLRYVTNSGGAMPVECVRKLRKKIPNTDVYLMYGLTESFRSTYLEPAMVDNYPSSIGKAVPGEQVMIIGKDGKEVKSGEIGELVHRGALVAQGYWGEQGLTDLRFRKNPMQLMDVTIDEKVVYSGDFAVKDEKGYIYYKGRKDEMIKSAGNRISPTEIEEILYNSGFINEVIAMGTPHEIYGQVVVVVLTILSQYNKSEKDILNYCRKNMPQYMVPHEIIIWDNLPKNTNGKLDRAAVKGMLNSEQK